MSVNVLTALADTGTYVTVNGTLRYREAVGQLIEVLDALATQLPLDADQAEPPTPITLRDATHG
jgi:hypothetical protein